MPNEIVELIKYFVSLRIDQELGRGEKYLIEQQIYDVEAELTEKFNEITKPKGDVIDK